MSPVEYAQLGMLKAVLVRSDASPPKQALVLCHGYGAPGDDLVPLANALLRMAPALATGTLFAFPEAPLQPRELRDFGGRAWWPLDMARLQAVMQSGQDRDLRRESPPRLPAACDELMSLLAELQTRFDIPIERTIVGGFSQGAMLAADAVLRMPQSPAALVIYSGALINEAEWSTLASRRSGLSVLQSHGTEDAILPFSAAAALRDLLMSAGCLVDYLPFSGGHTIPPTALRRTADLLQRLV